MKVYIQQYNNKIQYLDQDVLKLQYLELSMITSTMNYHGK